MQSRKYVAAYERRNRKGVREFNQTLNTLPFVVASRLHPLSMVTELHGFSNLTEQRVKPLT
jgi:hypothetical protein